MGLMGPTIAKDCAESIEVSKVTGCDIDKEKLSEALEYVSNPKFDVEELSVLNHDKLVKKMRDYAKLSGIDYIVLMDSSIDKPAEVYDIGSDVSRTVMIETLLQQIEGWS